MLKGKQIGLEKKVMLNQTRHAHDNKKNLNNGNKDLHTRTTSHLFNNLTTTIPVQSQTEDQRSWRAGLFDKKIRICTIGGQGTGRL